MTLKNVSPLLSWKKHPQACCKRIETQMVVVWVTGVFISHRNLLWFLHQLSFFTFASAVLRSCWTAVRSALTDLCGNMDNLWFPALSSNRLQQLLRRAPGYKSGWRIWAYGKGWSLLENCGFFLWQNDTALITSVIRRRNLGRAFTLCCVCAALLCNIKSVSLRISSKSFFHRFPVGMRIIYRAAAVCCERERCFPTESLLKSAVLVPRACVFPSQIDQLLPETMDLFT